MTFLELQHALTHAEAFNAFIQTNADLINAATNYPTLANALIEYVLDSPDAFERLINTEEEYEKTYQHFSAYQEQILNKVAGDPLLFERLMQKPLLNLIEKDEELNLFIKTTSEFISTLEMYPSLAEPLIKRIVTDLEQFKRVIKNDADLKKFKKFFKNDPDLEDLERTINELGNKEKITPFFCQYENVFFSSSRENALKTLTDIKEVKKNAKVMYVLRNSNSSLFFDVHANITEKIIQFVPRSDCLSNKETHDIVEKINMSGKP